MTEKAANPRRVVIGPIRLSYTYVAEPKENDHGEMEYSTQILIPEGSAAQKKAQQAVNAAIMACPLANGDKVKAGKLLKNPQFKKPLRSAADEGRDGAEYDGMIFANAKTNAKKGRPGIVLKSGTKLTDSDEIMDEIYSGCWAYVSVTAYYFDNSGNKGVALALNNIMKHKDDVRLDGSVDAEDEFADMFEEGDDDLGGDDDDFDAPPPRKGGKSAPKPTGKGGKPNRRPAPDDDFDLDGDDDDLEL